MCNCIEFVFSMSILLREILKHSVYDCSSQIYSIQVSLKPKWVKHGGIFIDFRQKLYWYIVSYHCHIIYIMFCA